MCGVDMCPLVADVSEERGSGSGAHGRDARLRQRLHRRRLLHAGLGGGGMIRRHETLAHIVGGVGGGLKSPGEGGRGAAGWRARTGRQRECAPWLSGVIGLPAVG